MTDKPILFSAPMVRALFAGTKTQTRRPMKLPTKGEYVRPDMGGWEASTVGGKGVFLRDGSPTPQMPCVWNRTTGTTITTGFVVGDRLWVKEEHYRFGHWVSYPGEETKTGRKKWCFLGDTDQTLFDPPAAFRKGMHRDEPWRPAWHKRLGRFMFRSDSRLTLHATKVRVERLQDISETDCLAEGAEIAGDVDRLGAPLDGVMVKTPDAHIFATPRAWYRELWDSINGAGSWDKNPWVVALTFTVERANIDQARLAA